jgi:DNA polymerase III subunit epsilon
MPGFLAIDTEGNGLFKYKDPETGKPVPADDPSQPRLAEFAAIYLDRDLQPEKEIQFYVKPQGWVMTDEATEVNGLVTEFLAEFGVPVRGVLDVYTDAIREGRAVIAFNAQHDCKQMRAELRRSEMDDLFMLTKNICTMRGSHPLGIVKASGKGGFPKLSDVCAHFDIVMPEAHNALDDARAAAEIARHLRRLEMLPEAMVHLAKNRG